MIVVVGAGLAGLSCAQELARAGREFLLLEAAEAPGGRVRSDMIDGFTLDRGFQVILSSYSAVSRAVDIASLRPRRFESGAVLWDGKSRRRLVSPLNSPFALWEAVTSSALSWSDKIRLARLTAGVLFTSDTDLIAGSALPSDRSVRDFLRSRRFSKNFIESFALPFFGGVLLDNELSTSAALFRYYFKKFATGSAWLPEGGIGKLPMAMADRLPGSAIRFGVRVAGLESTGQAVSGLILEDGSRLEASSVVLALDEPATCRLIGTVARPARQVAVVYFASERSLYRERMIVLPRGVDRTVRHFAQVTNVDPTLAPRGQHLISASVLDPGSRDASSLANDAQAEIEEVFPGSELRHLETVQIAYAVPAQPPGFAASSTHRHGLRNLVLAGDWSSGASIQSALESGQRAAALLP